MTCPAGLATYAWTGRTGGHDCPHRACVVHEGAPVVRALLVTNFATHYRAAFFERLARAMDVEFIFTSDGTEPYWQPHLGTTPAVIRANSVVGRRVANGLTFNPAIVREVWRRDCDVIIKCLNGRFELAGAYGVAKARGIPFVFWMTIWWHPMNAFGWLSYPAVLTIERGADAIVTDGAQISHFVAANGIADDKIFTAPLAVENERFFAPVDDAARLAIRQMVGATARPLVLAISRLVPEKGLSVLLHAAALLTDMRPVIAVVGTARSGPS